MYSIKKSLEKPVQATVTGTIPNWLSGTLYRYLNIYKLEINFFQYHL
jgi:hypothetical protein